MREGSLDLLGLSASRPACLEIWYRGICPGLRVQNPAWNLSVVPPTSRKWGRCPLNPAPNSNLSTMALRDSKALA